MMEEMKVNIAYLRVSTPQPKPGTKPRTWRGQQEASLPRQEEAAWKWYKDHRFPEPLVVIKDDCSGARRDRPGLKRTKNLIGHWKAKRLWIYDDSRAARDQLLFHQLMWHCFNYRVEVWFDNSGHPVDWESDEEHLHLGFRAFASEHWLRDHQRLVREGKRRAREAGVPLGVPAFGYRHTPEKKRVIVPDEADIVKRIFVERAQNESQGRIATRLEVDRRAGRIPGPRGGAYWTKVGVNYILQNPIYLGHTILNWRKHRAGGKGPRENQRVIRNTHPAIISQELWDKVQAIIPTRQGKKRNNGPA